MSVLSRTLLWLTLHPSSFFWKIENKEALESVMCDVIIIGLKRRIATSSRKGSQPLNIKTAVDRPILKLRLPKFRWSFNFILLHDASLLFRCIFMTSRMTLSRASKINFLFSIYFAYIRIDVSLWNNLYYSGLQITFLLMDVFDLVCHLFRKVWLKLSNSIADLNQKENNKWD